jgi:hypothetical protein
MSFSENGAGDSEQHSPLTPAIEDRAARPGRFLTLVGLFNLLSGFYFLHLGIQNWKMPLEQVRQQQQESLKQLAELGWVNDQADELRNMPPEDLREYGIRLFFTWAAVALIGGFLITYGGYNLTHLNSYRLATTGAILAAIPFVSPMGCCGIGEAIGIWSLVVLLNPEVRSAFP